MTPRGSALARRAAAVLEDVNAHHDDEPAEAEAIMVAIVAQVTAITTGKPASLSERASGEG